MLKKILYSVHRILGTILSILFLIWFLSGFVMIYHTFPKVSDEDRYAHMDVLSPNISCLDSILVKNDSIEKLILKSYAGNLYIETAISDSLIKLSLDSGIQSFPKPNFEQIKKYAKKWCDAEIARVDTLRELEQWIPFGRLKNDFPIYKFYFNDIDKHELYISSVTGEVLQFTDKNNRFWAWLGAIPHWVYFTSLRQNSQLWIDVLVCLSGTGCIMCLFGIIIGIRSYIIQYRKKKKLRTPYKKLAYKWHHILGFFFGIFVFTFVFSGMMSLADVPGWIVKVHNPDIQKDLFKTKSICSRDFKLDYTKILKQYPNQIKSIEWSYFGDLPIYKIIIDNKMRVFNASNEEVRLLSIGKQDITDRLSKIHKDSINIQLINEYDNYYNGKRYQMPLPVYKVTVDDLDKSTYYINPENGNIQYFNTNAKVRRWTYQGLHSFKINFLLKHPLLWNILMWTVLIGGTLVSITGVWLGFKYIKRKIKRLKNYICNLYKTKNNTCH